MDCDDLALEIRAAFGDAEPLEAPPDSVEGWSLFDALAFRAHLPASMLRALIEGHGRGLCWWLTLPLSGDEELHLQRWSLLDAAQRDCVRRFLSAMVERTRETPGAESERWEEAYESYWADFGPMGSSRA